MLTGLAQPVGQKRLTNVAVVRLKKHGNRFEVACYKNKVLSWRSGVEKDLDEVLHSETVYANVSRGILAKSKDLLDAFGVSDRTKICLEILEKGELQVAGKERESVLSKQFTEVATLVMQKTMNPQTRRPYTITMVERLMHRIHFGVDPTSSSKKQALEVIHELQKRFPIKKSPMKLRLTVPKPKTAALKEKLLRWKADVLAEEDELCGNESRFSVTCEMDPGFFRECDASLRSMEGWSEILVISVHVDTETGEDYDGRDEEGAEKMKKRSAVNSSKNASYSDAVAVKTEVVKQTNRCSTCNVVMDDAKKYREHFKSEWHIHNLRRKTMKLPPLTADECKVDHKNKKRSDRKDYSF